MFRRKDSFWPRPSIDSLGGLYGDLFASSAERDADLGSGKYSRALAPCSLRSFVAFEAYSQNGL
jgi:hypothetical protein